MVFPRQNLTKWDWPTKTQMTIGDHLVGWATSSTPSLCTFISRVMRFHTNVDGYAPSLMSQNLPPSSSGCCVIWRLQVQVLKTHFPSSFWLTIATHRVWSMMVISPWKDRTSLATDLPPTRIHVRHPMPYFWVFLWLALQYINAVASLAFSSCVLNNINHSLLGWTTCSLLYDYVCLYFSSAFHSL